MKAWLYLVAAIVCAVGVMIVYDARLISKKFFSSSDENSASLLLKILGFVFLMIGGLIIFFN